MTTTSSPTARYRRILVKLSGEALLGGEDYGIDPNILKRIAGEIRDLTQMGVQVAVVLGGGNIFRGAGLARAGMDRVTADHMGMLATVINALAMQDALEARAPMRGSCRRCASTRCARTTSGGVPCGIWRRAAWSSSAAGTGNPFFTTDTAASPARHRDQCRDTAEGDQGQRHLRFRSETESGGQALCAPDLRQGAERPAERDGRDRHRNVSRK